MNELKGCIQITRVILPRIASVGCDRLWLGANQFRSCIWATPIVILTTRIACLWSTRWLCSAYALSLNFPWLRDSVSNRSTAYGSGFRWEKKVGYYSAYQVLRDVIVQNGKRKQQVRAVQALKSDLDLFRSKSCDASLLQHL